MLVLLVLTEKSGYVYGIKLYPAGATTNSQDGVTDLFGNCYSVLEEMVEQGLPLLVICLLCMFSVLYKMLSNSSYRGATDFNNPQLTILLLCNRIYLFGYEIQIFFSIMKSYTNTSNSKMS
ncbi:hypothetical protein RYX36_035679 [Vicia faba]